MDMDKHELKSSVFICVYPWFMRVYGIDALAAAGEKDKSTGVKYHFSDPFSILRQLRTSMSKNEVKI